MKNKFKISFLFLLHVVFGFSQKCDTKIDPFTNDKVSAFIYVDIKKVVSIKYNSSKAHKELEMLFAFGGEINEKIPQGTEILMKLENGEVIILKTKVDAKPTTFYAKILMSSFTFITDVDLLTLNKLSLFKVTNMRYPAPQNRTLDLPTENKWSKKYLDNLMNGAKCIAGTF